MRNRRLDVRVGRRDPFVATISLPLARLLEPTPRESAAGDVEPQVIRRMGRRATAPYEVLRVRSPLREAPNDLQLVHQEITHRPGHRAPRKVLLRLGARRDFRHRQRGVLLVVPAIGPATLSDWSLGA